MENMNERPVCHRAEDLVTYLYGEASASEARDFAGHMKQCDACRAEFAMFSQVHESIALWRNEALGPIVSSAAQIASSPLTSAAAESSQFVHHERKLSALAALREFFSVSPLWLRGATAIASLLFCLLVVLAVARLWQRPVEVVKGGNELKYGQQDLDREVQRQLAEKLASLNSEKAPPVNVSTATAAPKNMGNRVQLASNRAQFKTPRVKGLTRQEREQLAADLRLIPGRDDEELPFVLRDEPNP